MGVEADSWNLRDEYTLKPPALQRKNSALTR